MDSNGFCNNDDGPDGMWLPVVVTNIDATETYDGLEVTLAPPANTVADDPTRFIGDLAPGASAEVFFFIDYRTLRTLGTCSNGTDGWYSSPYTITVDSVVPGGMSAPAVFNDTFSSLSMISAAAGGAMASDFLGPGAGVGQIFTQNVVYDFGNNPAGSDLYLQPSGNGSFNDQCYRLVGSEIIASDVIGVSVGVTDQLFFTGTDTANGDEIEVQFRWEVLCNPGTETTTYPWAEITSGTQFKYNEGGYVPTTFPLPEPVESQVSVTKTASPSVLPTGGVVTYTVTFSNAFSQPLYVNDITDVLPAGVTFINETVASSVQDANSAVTPSSGATGTINWYGIPIPTASKTYAIPAGGSISLIYTANVPNTPGVYTNSLTATIGSTTIGPVTADVVVGQPNLTIAKSNDVGGSVILGNNFNWTLAVDNTGTGPAVFTTGQTIVSDTLPGGLTYNSATVSSPVGITGTIACNIAANVLTCTASGGTVTIAATTGSFDVVVSVTPTAGGTFTNLGAGCRVDPNGNISESSEADNNCADNTVTVLVPELTLTKTGIIEVGDGDGIVEAGETISYTFQVTNTGDVTITNITVSDPLVPTITCPGGNPIPSLTTGTNVNCTGTYTLTQADIDAGERNNTATAAGTDPGGNPVSDDDTENITLPASPALTLTKTGTFNDDGDGVAEAGETISYSFLVENTGNVTISNITVSDALIPTITCPGGNPIPSLISGASVTCTGSYTIAQADVNAGQRANTATAAGTDPGGNPVSNDDTETITLPASPALTLTKTGTLNDDGDGVAETGETISYSFLVENTGNVTISNITVSDPLIPTITCPGGNPIPSLVAGDSVTCTGSYSIAQADVNAGERNNTATAAGTDPGGNPVSDDDTETTTLPQAAALTLTKTGTFNDDGDSVAEAGETISYSFLVENTGNVTISNITVSDPLIPAITCPGGNPIPSLISGDSVTCTGSYTIAQADVNAGQRANTATAAGTDPGGNPVSDDDTETTTLPQAAALTLTKTGTFNDDGDGVAEAGETISYSLLVENTGNVTISNITVSDPLIPTITCPGGNPIPSLISGASVTCTGSYTIAQADVNAGQRANTATAAGTDPGGNPVSDNDTDTTVFNASADLNISKVDSADPVNVGDTVTYTITVNNAGPDDASNVTVSDTFSGASVSIDSVTSSQGGCTAFPCNLGTIASGGSATITVTVTANASGTISNTPFVDADEGDPDTSDNTVTETTTVTGTTPPVPTATPVVNNNTAASVILVFDPAVSKIGFLQTGDLGLQNEQVVWFVTVFNNGNATGTNIVITDTLRPELRVDSIDVPPPASGTINGQTVTVNLPSLAPGATYNFSITTTVISGGATVDNTVCLRADNYSGEQCVTAPAILTQPATGETPLWRYLLIGLVSVASILVLIVGGIWRIRHRSHA